MKISRNYLIFSVVANILILGFIYSYFNLRTKSINNLGGNKVDTTYTSTTTNSDREIQVNNLVKDQISNVFKDIYSNRLPYKQNTLGTPMYQKTFSGLFTDDQITTTFSIDAIKYTNNMSIEQGYEGLRWTWDVGAEVKELLSLKSGTHILPSFNSDGDIDGLSFLAYTTKENPSRYTYYDSFFPPARSYDRRFIIIDPTRSQHITVLVSLQSNSKTLAASSKEVCFEEKCAQIFTYTGEAEKILNQAEYIVQENLPRGAR
jgi:hypothetical protein